MRRLLVLALAGALTVLTGTGVAAANGGTDHFGPFTTSSLDGSSCGGTWAMDTYDRSYTVHDNGDGTFKVTADSKHGTFVTTGPGSPGACDNSDRHGSTVNAGVNGGFQGFLSGTVTNSTYDPAGCDAAGADCQTTQGFLAAVFGLAPFSSAFTCNAGYDGCVFNFEYHSSDQSLQYHAWLDKSDNHGGEMFVGDIANQ
jgi:hypothetical protein